MKTILHKIAGTKGNAAITILGGLLGFAVPYITGETDWRTITIGTIIGLIGAITGKPKTFTAKKK